ncbi:MAG: pyruvate formate lyase family protein [Desulfatiglans sp.]|jgi:formate C-acetyltransferase|nr:pyruvate formate lyase family protein [Thermodesulfobacteriota bacterium]MEE4351729.1 pyruvate formate lyase family protein [Desulfatiglans sp.]
MTIVASKYDRPQKLKENMVRKDFQTWKEPGKRHELRWGPKGTEVRMCLERGRLITASYKETEGEPEVIRRAKSLAHILENMTIYISDYELIVGNYASDPSLLPITPELSVEWLERELIGPWNDLLDEDGHQEFKEIADYWRERCIDGRVRSLLPEDLKPWIKYRDNEGVVSADEFQMDRAWPALDYEKVLHIGFDGILEEARSRLEEIQSEVPSRGEKIEGWIDKIDFLKAVIIVCDGVIRFAHRFAFLAREMSEEEKDLERKEELLEIAKNCEQVPQYPAENLWQALQAWWFTYLIGYNIEAIRHGSPCRFDQLMYPFYKKDKEEGRLTREEAQELVGVLQMKVEDTGQIALPSYHVVGSGVTQYQKFTIGGVDAQGRDASNEFSLIMLDAAMKTRTCQAAIALRYHPKLDEAVLDKSIDCIRSGLGYPDIYNDTHVISRIQNKGVPLELARDYAPAACISYSLPKKNTQVRVPQGCFLALGKCLELALNEGKSMGNGTKQIGYKTPDPLGFSSIDEVMEAYLKQVNFAMDKVSRINNIALDIYRRYGQIPFCSSLLDGCIERGMDCTAWTEYPYHQIVFSGSVNVADSLAAMSKLVFDDKAVSMAELLTALKANFEGHEELRQRLLNEGPKFGNDDEYVDTIMHDVMHKTYAEVQKFTNLFGAPWTLDGSPASGYYGAGRATWALPDGKREGRIDTYADGTLSPGAGRDKRGPTAVINSMGRVDTPNTQTCNQKFMPQFLEDENKKIFASYLKTWSEMGNWEIQFNVVDKDTLLAAQEKPEDHPDLIVRVAGYSAYFIDLPPGVQKDIISRTAQSFS